MTRLGQNPDLTPTRRRDLISAVRRISAMTGVDPRSTPATMRALRASLNKVRPARYGLSFKTWSTLRANFRAAIVDPAPRGRRRYGPEWAELRRLLPDERTRDKLSRFTGFCHDQGIPPSAVSDAVFELFLEK